MNVIITAIGGSDRPGIIAALTKAIYELGGNLDDATMTRLRGAFANMLAATLPEGKTIADAQARLSPVAQELDLQVAVYEIPDEEPQEEISDHIISVYGADQPGIVHRITSLLAEHGANITDLDTRLAGVPSKPIYVMLLETAGGDWTKLPEVLAERGKALGVDITVREIETETL
ncbi:MAG: ACT domain-containing protein [Capsulimonadaceae bacterium]|nr:ACT domain-containing protein [Capsulimonadaceae bacterium]